MIVGYTVTTEAGTIEFDSDPESLVRLGELQDTLFERGRSYTLVAHSDTDPVPYYPTELLAVRKVA